MPEFKGRIIVFDVETGGLDCDKAPLCEIALVAVDVQTGDIINTFQSYVKPYMPVSDYNPHALQANGLTVSYITDNGRDRIDVMKDVLAFIKSHSVKVPRRTIKPMLVAHNADFDMGFLGVSLYEALEANVYDFIDPIVICTMRLMQMGYPMEGQIDNHKLGTCCAFFGIPLEDAHSALPDTIATAKLAMKLLFNRGTPVQTGAATQSNQINEFRKGFRF